MGLVKQFNALCTDADLGELSAHLIARGDTVFLANEPTSDFAELTHQSGLLAESGKFVQCYLVPAQWPQQIYIRRLSDPNFVVQEDVSRLVSFRRPPFDGKRLVRGVFRYQVKFYEAGTYVDKESEFSKWADGLARAIKKHLTLDKKGALLMYIGKDAAAGISQGRIEVVPHL